MDKLKTIEKDLECVIYNKENIIKYIDDEKVFEKLIKENAFHQVEFNKLFKGDLGFSLIFNNDNVVILYEDKRITKFDLDNILSNIKNHNTEYIKNIKITLDKFMNKDLSVKYNCINIPEYYWKLFEMKCFKNNKNADVVYNQYIDIHNIMFPSLQQEENKIEYDKYPIYKLEILNYLNDNEICIFVNMIEQFEKKDFDYYNLQNYENPFIDCYYMNNIIKNINKKNINKNLLISYRDRLYNSYQKILETDISFLTELDKTFIIINNLIDIFYNNK